MASTPRTRIRLGLGLVALVPVLGACSPGGDTDPETTTDQTTTATTIASTQAPTQTTTATTPPSSSPTASPTTGSPSEETATTGEVETSTSAREVRLSRDVEEVYEIFQSLAPRSLFEDLDSCNPSGLENSWACTGSEAGQFQFFANNAKAASTTQLLTELRSSRVVEDTGSRIVGWTTMGTTSIVTVVDNDEGLVLQQMVSSDRIDPEDRIYELGLVEPPADWEPSPTAVPETTKNG